MQEQQMVLTSVPTETLAHKIIEGIKGYIDDKFSEFKTQQEINVNTEIGKLLTRKETAKLFGVSLVTLHEWVKTGKVKSFRIGKAVRFKEDDVMAALQEQKFGTLPRNLIL